MSVRQCETVGTMHTGCFCQKEEENKNNMIPLPSEATNKLFTFQQMASLPQACRLDFKTRTHQGGRGK